MANEACCTVRSAGSIGGGIDIGGGGSLLSRIARAVDNAVHGGDSGGVFGNGGAGGANGRGGAGGYYNAPVGGNVIPFPMVDPYYPAGQTRVPIAGYNAFPKVADIVNFSYRVESFNTRGDDESEKLPEGSESLGFYDAGASAPQGISLPSSNPSNLQLILDTIARTLPATISAAKKQPYYNPAQTGSYGYPIASESGYYATGSPGANIGSQAGAAVGNVGDTISSIVTRYPLLVLGGGAALLLLFMSPPRRRR